MPERVVITGVGSICAFGLGPQALLDGLRAGEPKIGPIARFDASGFRARIAGEVKNVSIREYVPKHYRKATKVMARDTELAVIAAHLAVQDAKLTTRGSGEEVPAEQFTYPAGRLGCNIGAGLIAAESDEMSQAMTTAATVPTSAQTNRQFSLRAWGGEGGHGMDALTPLWLLKYLPNMLACHVTIIHGCEGPSNTITCGEASGLLSLGESLRILQRGAADACLCGSAESKVNPMGLLRMDLAGRLSSSVERTPEEQIRGLKPHDPASVGGILGEGGGIVVLEGLEAARARGQTPYAEVVGFGSGQSDAHYRAGDQDEGFRYAIENALEDAKISANEIDLIVPLGCGVSELDRPEVGALKSTIGGRFGQIPTLFLHPLMGNCVAGAGGLQLAAASLCLKHQICPPQYGNTHRIRHALVCSGSLGGQNAAVVLKAL